eukprot:maker-scaffold632_size121914-snap-gene-0.24 protein:Tk02604 transcript:maker-scaffold632_size121914-snap-gene-0.24-mRNA-1 annotation:"hypothetical protein DAPPUDRAFT_316118"
MQDLSQAEQTLDRGIQDQVSTHYEDLLSQATSVEQLESHLDMMESHMESLMATSERLRAQVREPHRVLRTQVLTLGRLQATIMKLSLFLIFCLCAITLLNLTPESEAANRGQLRRNRQGAAALRARSQGVSPRRKAASALLHAQRYTPKSARAGKAVRRPGRKSSRRSGKAVRRTGQQPAVRRRNNSRLNLRQKSNLRQRNNLRNARRFSPKSRPVARRQSARVQKQVQSRRGNAGRRVQPRKQRRGRKALRKYFQRRRRFGRQGGEMIEEAEPVEPINAVEAEDTLEAMDEAVEDPAMQEDIDANGDGIPDWCNPIKPMGAWLNFRNMKIWCADHGFTKFGPYGGVPTKDAPKAPEAVAEGTEAVEEADIMDDMLEYDMEYDDADQAAAEEGGDEDVDY